MIWALYLRDVVIQCCNHIAFLMRWWHKLSFPSATMSLALLGCGSFVVDLALALHGGWLHYCQYRWAKARVPHAKHLRSVCRGFRYLFICDMSLLLACIVLVSSGCTFTRLSFSVPSSSALLPACLLCCTLFFQLPHFFFLLWKHEGRNRHQPQCSTEPQKPSMCSSEWKLCSWRRILLFLGTEPKTFPKQPLYYSNKRLACHGTKLNWSTTQSRWKPVNYKKFWWCETS